MISPPFSDQLRRRLWLTFAAGLAVLAAAGPVPLAAADDAWNPFRYPGEEPRPPRRTKPPDTAPSPDADVRRPPLASIDREGAVGSGDAAERGATGPRDGAGAAWGDGPGSGAGSTYAPPGLGESSRGVEREELAPVMAGDGSGLPFELWRGLDIAAFEGHLAKLDIPPRSPTLHALWRRLLTSAAGAPGSGGARFDAIRTEALFRSGLVGEAAALAARSVEANSEVDPAIKVVAARVGLATTNPGAGCEPLKSVVPRKADLPRPLQRELLILSGACAAINGNPGGAGLAAELIREDVGRDPKSDDPASLAALDAAASQSKTAPRGKTITIAQHRLHQIGGNTDLTETIARGEPAVVASIALDTTADGAARAAAAEAAARFHALSAAELANVWRSGAANVSADQLLPPAGQRRLPSNGSGASGAAAASLESSAQRAALYRAAEGERTPLKKVRLIRALLDDARRAGLYWQSLEALSPVADTLQPVPELGWFAETGIEIALAAGKPERARQWANLGGAVPGDGGLRHWLPLIDIADPSLKGERGRSLASLEDMALRGRLPADLLHRLATVLDAHDINVPIPLWEATSKAAQPAGGYLPETGVLSDLQDAAKKKEFGRTVLLVMRTLGPTGAEGANIIALGDSIRALRRAGLDADARRLGLEALFAQWPRGAAN